MSRKFATWIMTLLFLVLLGLTGWIIWAVNKVDEARKAGHSAVQRPADAKP